MTFILVMLLLYAFCVFIDVYFIINFMVLFISNGKKTTRNLICKDYEKKFFGNSGLGNAKEVEEPWITSPKKTNLNLISPSFVY